LHVDQTKPFGKEGGIFKSKGSTFAWILARCV
jgi:hypothetical protein